MHKGQGGGPGTIRPEQRDTRGDGIQNQKGDPKKLAEEKQPYPVSGVYHDQHDQREKAGPDGQATQRGADAAPKPQYPIQGNPPSATTPSVQFGSPPLGPEERWKQQLEERARLRAEWRGQRR